jgi:hypothetical protein
VLIEMSAGGQQHITMTLNEKTYLIMRYTNHRKLIEGQVRFSSASFAPR